MKDPSIYYMGDRPYNNYKEYLEDLFAVMDIFLLQTVKGNCPFLERKMKDRELTDRQNLSDWENMIEDRRSFSIETGMDFPIENVLIAVCGDAFVRNILVLSMLMALGDGYRQVLLQIFPECDGKLTSAVGARLFFSNGELSDLDVYEIVHEYQTSLKCLFPDLELEEDLTGSVLLCDVRLIDIILGWNHYLPEGASVFDRERGTEVLLFRENEKKKVCEFIQNREMPLVMLWGPEGAGKKHLLSLSAFDAGRTVLFLCIPWGKEKDSGFSEIKKRLLSGVRECVLFNRILAVTGFEKLGADQQHRLALWLDKKRRSWGIDIFIIYETEDYRNCIPGVFSVELGIMKETERIGLWDYYLKNENISDNFSSEAIANTFNITPGQITGAIRQARLMGDGKITEDLLYEACYIQLDYGLEEKAARIKPSFGWDDLKLAPEDKEILRDVCHCVKIRHRVLREWNFAKVVPYGGGITVLFSGPPGTGKTMAAQVVANELHMELYKVDLSQVIDKYVGETEKNIKHIFDLAQKSNCVLFFDEADAIFNKRLEASGANERFANIESSLLLQCIEEYSGITILATNNFTSIDNAFIRRFKYYLLFKEPDEKMRYEIWKSVFPKEAPVNEEVDFRELAHIFEFTGAIIKNVALSAAYLAAWENRDICLADILKSVRREMVKNNLILTQEKMGSLGYLFDEITGIKLENS